MDREDREWRDPRTSGDWLTRRIVACAFRVSNGLGAGFLEKVYENALVHELRKMGLSVTRQRPVHVVYDAVIVGDYVMDLVVEDAVVVEVKAAKAIDSVHEAQLLNYLRAAGLHLGLLLNFGTPRLGVRRLIL